MSRGIVSGIRDDENARHYQITAPISPGSSGGPILDDKGEVLGVATFYVGGGQNLNFAVPSLYVRDLLNSPRRSTIANIASQKGRVSREFADERVYIAGADLNGLSGNLTASVVNKTDYVITNVRVVVAFFQFQNLDDPLHFMLIEISDTIPPGLGKRFTRQDNGLRRQHSPSLSHSGERRCTYADKHCWDTLFRVLDYEIIGGGNEGIPVFE
jgi:hypothetical protein